MCGFPGFIRIGVHFLMIHKKGNIILLVIETHECCHAGGIKYVNYNQSLNNAVLKFLLRDFRNLFPFNYNFLWLIFIAF